MKLFQEKIKDLVIEQKQKGSKKNIENLVVFLIILIVTFIAINTILKDDKKSKSEEQIYNSKSLATEITEQNKENESDDLEKRLEDILSQIDGVGNVSVLITYSQTSEVIAMYNENSKESFTEEADNDGRD